MKYITFSRQFPTGHPKAGQPTDFVEKILLNILHSEEITIGRCIELARQIFDKEHPMCSFNAIRGYECQLLKGHTIRAGSRFKPGETISLRVWSDKPYHSKQTEFAQVEVKNVWNIEISEFWFINGVILEHDKVKELAANDGLAYDDFISWFKIHPKKEDDVFKGQIICWNHNINY